MSVRNAMGETWFYRLLFKTAEIVSEYSHDICLSNLYIVLSICLLLGVLDRFLVLHVFSVYDHLWFLNIHIE